MCAYDFPDIDFMSFSDEENANTITNSNHPGHNLKMLSIQNTDSIFFAIHEIRYNTLQYAASFNSKIMLSVSWMLSIFESCPAIIHKKIVQTRLGIVNHRFIFFLKELYTIFFGIVL